MSAPRRFPRTSIRRPVTDSRTSAARVVDDLREELPFKVSQLLLDHGIVSSVTVAIQGSRPSLRHSGRL